LPSPFTYAIIKKNHILGGFLVGELLKKKREELGKDLREISDILKIKRDYLKAIEEENFSMLPEEVYVKGYIRKYAELLKINPESALNSYNNQISSSRTGEKDPFQQELLQKKKRLKSSYIVAALVIIVFVIILTITGFFQSPREEYSALAPLKTKNEVSQPSAQSAQESSPLYPEEKQYTQSGSVDQNKPASSSVPGVTNQITTTDRASHVLEISAKDTTWLLITIDEVNTKELTMYPGESVKFQAAKGFSLKVGNAGGIKLNFDNKEIKNLGEKGEVINLHLPGV
jgi:cytoskeletal protein RodZ